MHSVCVVDNDKSAESGLEYYTHITYDQAITAQLRHESLNESFIQAQDRQLMLEKLAL